MEGVPPGRSASEAPHAGGGMPTRRRQDHTGGARQATKGGVSAISAQAARAQGKRGGAMGAGMSDGRRGGAPAGALPFVGVSRREEPSPSPSPQRQRQSQPPRGSRKRFDVRRDAPPPQWYSEGAMDPILSEDSVGALVAKSTMPLAKFQGLVDVKRSVRAAYHALPALPGQLSPERMQLQRRSAPLRCHPGLNTREMLVELGETDS